MLAGEGDSFCAGLDFATVLEAPDETTMARVSLVLGARGTLKTLTMVAIPIDGYVEDVLRARTG